MFDSNVLIDLATDHRPVLQTLHRVEQALLGRFADMALPIRALILSVASGEPLLLVGPPGTAKSRLIRAFCALVGLLDEDDLSQDREQYFEYLLTPFTEPGELFGFYDVSQAMQGGQLERIEDGMMQRATVVYLDEVFNGSSAILNSILAFLNERIFHDRGRRRKVAMQYLFAATNQVPESAELRAVFDRFVLRCYVDNVTADPVALTKLLQAGWTETYTGQHRGQKYLHLLADMQALRERIVFLSQRGALKPQPDHDFYKRLAQLVQHVRQYELSEMSNRRLIKMIHIMLIHALYEAANSTTIPNQLELGEAQLQLLTCYFLDHLDEEVMWSMMGSGGG